VAYNFISGSPDGSLLSRHDVRGWLPPQHLCWEVLKVVGELDLSGFLRGYRADGQGAAGYPPQVLLSLVLYCYCKGVRSSRRIEAACLDDVGCRIITGNQHIDHATVARFLRRRREGLKALFVQVLALCAGRGLVDMSAVAVDGSPRALNPRPIPSAAAGASLTDPASRLMLGKHGGYVQGYNVQIACARNQVFLAIELHDNPSDTTALVPVIRRAQHNCGAAGLTSDIAAWPANSGYASTANFAALADLPLLVSITKEYDQTRAATSPGHDVPAGHRDMAARLTSADGKQLYARRGALVEPGFAQLFQRFGRRVHHRGTASVDAEIKLLGAVHNLNRIFRHDARWKAA
jgi:transposase